jgi:hypothetical protein
MTPLDRRLAAALFLTLACVYMLTSGGHFYASDDLQKLRLLDSLWRDGDFTIAEGWVRGANHARYSWFPIGASLVMLPGWAIGQLFVHAFPMLPADYVVRFFVSLENAVVTGGLVALAYLFARRLGATARGAGAMALALGLGTMAWPYAKTAWSEPTATLFVLLGLWGAWAGDAASGRKRLTAWLGAGLALASAASIRQEMGLIALGAALWLAFRHRAHWKAIGVALGVPLLGIALVALWYNQVRYGHALDFQNYRLPQKNLVMEEGRFGWSLKNVYQYLLSPNQGLVWYSPAIVAGLLGLRRLPKPLLGLFASALAPLAIFYVYGWGLSSWAWGLRYTYVFVPVLMLGAAFLDTARKRTRAIAASAVGLGVAVQLVAITHDYNRLYEDELFAYRLEHLTIQRLMTTPAHAPLRLALQATPGTIANGAALLASPGSPSDTVLEYRARRRHVPDFWFVLQLLSPIPRKLTLAAVLLLAALTAAAATWLAVLMRRTSVEHGLEAFPTEITEEARSYTEKI